MRTAAYENFYQKLLATTKCIDINEIEKYISNSTANDAYLINRQLYKANNLLEERYKRYGVLTEGDDMEAIRKGYYDLGKISLTLKDVQRKIALFKIDKESEMGIQIEKDWDNVVFFLFYLLQLENMNLITYIRLLEEMIEDVNASKDDKKKKKASTKKSNKQETKLVNNSLNYIPNDFMTVEDICIMLRLSKRKIYLMASDREIPHYKLDPNKKGRLYFSRSEIEAWLKRNRIGTTEEFCRQFD